MNKEKLREDFCCKNCSRCKFFEITETYAKCNRPRDDEFPEGSFLCHDENICDHQLAEGRKKNSYGVVIINNSATGGSRLSQ